MKSDVKYKKKKKKAERKKRRHNNSFDFICIKKRNDPIKIKND